MSNPAAGPWNYDPEQAPRDRKLLCDFDWGVLNVCYRDSVGTWSYPWGRPPKRWAEIKIEEGEA